MPVRAGRHRQHRDRGPRLHVARAGVATGIDLGALIEVAEWLAQRLHKTLPGMVYKAGGFEAVAG